MFFPISVEGTHKIQLIHYIRKKNPIKTSHLLSYYSPLHPPFKKPSSIVPFALAQWLHLGRRCGARRRLRLIHDWDAAAPRQGLPGARQGLFIPFYTYIYDGFWYITNVGAKIMIQDQFGIYVAMISSKLWPVQRSSSSGFSTFCSIGDW
jgi:hypothetical protein